MRFPPRSTKRDDDGKRNEKEDGCDVEMLEIAGDTPEDLRRKIAEGLEFDALVTSGGVSVGSHDHVLEVLKSLKVDVKFWKVNIKPGKPRISLWP